VKSVCLNVFKAANSKLQTQVVVPRSANYESFRVSSSRTSWIDDVLDAMTPEGGTQSESAYMLLHNLINNHPEAFVRAADDCDLPVQVSPFSADEFMAMCFEGNINRNGQRMLRKYCQSKGMKIFPSTA